MNTDEREKEPMSRFTEFERMSREILEHRDKIEMIDFTSRLKNGTKFTFSYNQRRWERRQKPDGKLDHAALFNGIFDIIAIAVSVAILVMLIIYAESASGVGLAVSFSFFASSLIIYNLFSSLYHFFSSMQATRKVFEQLKSMFRFFVVLTAFAPVYLLYIGEAAGLLFFMITLVLAVVGIFFTYTDTTSSRILARIISALMALVIFAAAPAAMETFAQEELILLSFSSLLYALWGVSPLLCRARAAATVNFSNFFMVTGSLGFFWFFLRTLLLG